MKVMVIPVIIGALSTVPQRLIKGLEDLEIKGRVETIVEISQNTKSLGDLRRLAVPQTPVENHQLMFM